MEIFQLVLIDRYLLDIDMKRKFSEMSSSKQSLLLEQVMFFCPIKDQSSPRSTKDFVIPDQKKSPNSVVDFFHQKSDVPQGKHSANSNFKDQVDRQAASSNDTDDEELSRIFDEANLNS